MTAEEIARLRALCAVKGGTCPVVPNENGGPLCAAREALPAALDEIERLSGLLRNKNDLGCDHCGDVAYFSTCNNYWDGDGGHCQSCGFPGHVSADGHSVYFSLSDDDDAACDRNGCDDCRGLGLDPDAGAAK